MSAGNQEEKKLTKAEVDALEEKIKADVAKLRREVEALAPEISEETVTQLQASADESSEHRGACDCGGKRAGTGARGTRAAE